MKCEEVRGVLPDVLLGSLDEVTAAGVARHLRGCAGCRHEQSQLEEGIDALSRAAHDETPPAGLRRRVLDVLGEEWRDDEPATSRGFVAPPSPLARRTLVVVAAAAALLLLVVSLAWGLGQRQRATLAEGDATSYRTILQTLGGKDFRVGAMRSSSGWGGLGGQVVVYDGDTGGGWTSWALVFLQSDQDLGEVSATLVAPDGRTLSLPSMTFRDGAASTWLVTPEDLTAFDELTVTGPDGLIATTRFRDA
jgi:hypothetical protein